MTSRFGESRSPCETSLGPRARPRNTVATSSAPLRTGTAGRQPAPLYAGINRFGRCGDVRFACHGGCPKDGFVKTASGESGLNYLCEGYLAFFHHTDRPMKVMCELLARGRAPSEITGMFAAQDAARARDESLQV